VGGFKNTLMFHSRELHIAPGTSAGGCMKQAFNLPAGSLLDDQDLLSIGPLPPLRTIDEWRRIRQEYLQTLYPEFPFSFADFQRDLLSNTQSLREANSVTLWIGTGLAEQLLLSWMVQLFRVLGIDPEKMRVIQFSHDPITGDEIQSTGMLNPEALKAHPPAISLNEAALASLVAAWSAVTAPEPKKLVAFLNAEPGPLPFLQRSLQSLMFRFPDVETGLGHWEMELLKQVVEKGPTAVKVIGFTMIRGLDSLDWVGDAFLFARLRNLADQSLRQPLISLSGDAAKMREAEVHLTETGKDVLAGKQNSVTVNGIDDWVCGVHLDSVAGQVWFQRNGILVDSHR
jgi:hypothetical protein